MKIASITIYCNERFRLDAWKEYYAGYKEELYLHVIVNNGDKEETAVLREHFPDSLILESPTKNMMASYNLALTKILEDPEVDALEAAVPPFSRASSVFFPASPSAVSRFAF